ncbi:hypothetical protein CTAYLR_002473 [Chrysophaeum taylorii]|uniref:Kinesin-like protein n=1 Tax=Chrysophaeum taylorii TaxID=2483200 RepID=A0AAD7XPL7_9STRA|nr:hypothetical protein CTAYLR_002473 [Chrysophaeum taylorii]
MAATTTTASPRIVKARKNDAVRVVVRVRPVLPREREAGIATRVDHETQTVTVCNSEEDEGELSPRATHSFEFDTVYDESASQFEVYETTARPVVESCLEGYNATIFAYGQTGTGKTYTQYGRSWTNGDDSERGIIPRAVEQIFGHVSSSSSPNAPGWARTRFLVRASCLQIYQEQVSDLLDEEDDDGASTSSLPIREDPKRGVYVEGLSELVVKTPREVYQLMERASRRRATGATRMNDVSSRSHAVFAVVVEQSASVYVDDEGAELSPEDFARTMRAMGLKRDEALTRLEDRVRQTFLLGKLNLVDLAGSERVRISGASGVRLEESKKINASLSSLGNVIAALSEKRRHVPYRDSKLTRLLEDSLGGNCLTTMLATVSPSRDAASETVSTLKFATRAMSVTNEPRVNQDLDQKSLLRKYERELKRLRAELDERNRHVVDQRRLLELDERRRQAEEDKMAAIRALEARSREFMREKQEKHELEERIARLTSQIVFTDDHGGGLTLREPRRSTFGAAYHASPDRASNLSSHPRRRRRDDLDDDDDPSPEEAPPPPEPQPLVRNDYDDRLADLEHERQSIVEEKAQVERYKQLLLKQRDIMIALTQRLNERDEQIVALQDELDAYDKNQADLENKLDEKTAQCIHLQRVQLEGILGAADAPAPGADPSSKKADELRRLRADLDRAQRDAATARTDLAAQASQLQAKDAELATLKQETRASPDLAKLLDLRDKERKAVQTIFEKKLAVLVDSVDANVTDNVKAAKRDLAALRRLVNASVEALRQADAEAARHPYTNGSTPASHRPPRHPERTIS